MSIPEDLTLNRNFRSEIQMMTPEHIQKLEEAIKQANCLHVGDGNPLTDLSWLDDLQEAAQTLLSDTKYKALQERCEKLDGVIQKLVAVLYFNW